jgi:hypothetical protein
MTAVPDFKVVFSGVSQIKPAKLKLTSSVAGNVYFF